MTQEEKAQAYDEALERARLFQEKYGGDFAQFIFPDLMQSDDERIRKAIVDCVSFIQKDSVIFSSNCVTKEQVLEYLEKVWVRWHKINRGERLPCYAYLWSTTFENKASVWEGRLIPNVKGVVVGADTWYLPVDDIVNLPKE